ncbi:hypothetical protein P3S67_011932 [Capsicum chacoense]
MSSKTNCVEYFIDPNDWFKSDPHWRGNSNYHTMSFLDDDTQLSLLEKRVFGNLMKLGNLNPSGNLLHCMLLSKVKCNKNNLREFYVKGSYIEFTLDVFGLVTGLSTKSSSIVLSSIRKKGGGSRLLNTYFDGANKLKMGDLKNFMETRKGEVQNDLDVVKLADIYSRMRVVGGRLTKVIYANLIMILEDADLCREYGWSELSFNETISSLKSSLKPTKTTVGSSYQLVGFPYAFMVWTWDIFSKYREKNVQIVSEEKYPLMLRYVACTTPQYTTVVKFFKSKKSKSSKGAVEAFSLEHELPSNNNSEDKRFSLLNQKLNKLQRTCSKRFKKIFDENKSLKSKLSKIKTLLLGKLKADRDILSDKQPDNFQGEPSHDPMVDNQYDDSSEKRSLPELLVLLVLNEDQDPGASLVVVWKRSGELKREECKRSFR